MIISITKLHSKLTAETDTDLFVGRPRLNPLQLNAPAFSFTVCVRLRLNKKNWPKVNPVNHVYGHSQRAPAHLIFGIAG
jgi:hypothetical protein